MLGFMHLKRIFSRSSLQQTLLFRAWQPHVSGKVKQSCKMGVVGARETRDEALTWRPLDNQRGSDNHGGIRLQCLHRRSNKQDQTC